MRILQTYRFSVGTKIPFERLPGIKWEPFTRIVMDENEQADYEARNRQVIPFIEAAKTFFTAQMSEEKGNNDSESPVSVAAWLKKMGKRYGYTYSGCRNFIYFMEKKLPGGHYVCLAFVSSPDEPAVDPFIKLCGLGFRHEIWVDGFEPQNPRDAEHYFTRLFDTLATAEKLSYRQFWTATLPHRTGLCPAIEQSTIHRLRLWTVRGKLWSERMGCP